MLARVSSVLFALLACSSAPATVQPVQPVQPVREPPPAAQAEMTTPLRVTEVPAGEGIEGTVRLAVATHGKQFQGVWLERPDGERLVLSYRADDWLKSLDGRAVRSALSAAGSTLARSPRPR